MRTGPAVLHLSHSCTVIWRNKFLSKETFFIITADLTIKTGSKKAIQNKTELRPGQQPHVLECLTVQRAVHLAQTRKVQ
jgi:hypothetical protein